MDREHLTLRPVKGTLEYGQVQARALQAWRAALPATPRHRQAAAISVSASLPMPEFSKPPIQSRPGRPFTPELRTLIHGELRRSVPAFEQRDAFIEWIDDALREHFPRERRDDLSAKTLGRQKRDLAAIAKTARQLRLDLQAAQLANPETIVELVRIVHAADVELPVDHIGQVARTLMHDADPYAFLAVTWDIVEALEAVAKLAAARLVPSRHDRPAMTRGRSVALIVAGYWVEVLKIPAPTNPKSILVHVLAAIGRHLDIPIGPRQAAQAATAANKAAFG